MKVYVLMEDSVYKDLGTMSRPIGIYSTEAAAEEAKKKLSSANAGKSARRRGPPDEYWVTESTFNQGE